MRQQHNAKSEDKRNCWRTARERNRIRARYEIQKRVSLGLTGSAIEHKPNAPKPDHTMAASSVKDVLYRILDGDRSFFSLSYVEEHHVLLSTPFSTDILLFQDEFGDKRNILGKQKLISWFGYDAVESLEAYFNALSACTFWDYAVWLERYHIVGALILGGIIPTVRGRLRADCDSNECCEQNFESFENDLLQSIGGMIRKQFFSGVVPLSLSSYIVKCAVKMRRSAWERLNSNGYRSEECCMCSRITPPNLQLNCSDDTIDISSCQHVFCEPCFWNDINAFMYNRLGNVVLCPMCAYVARLTSEKPSTEMPNIYLNPTQQREQSRDRYNCLPKDGLELKNKCKKRFLKEKNTLCSTWTEAVKPSLGTSQSVRKDKFFAYLERKNSYHYIKGFLEEGIDLDLRNEYGQSALFFASWCGDLALVKLLLLEYDCDPNDTANGGLTSMGTAKASRHYEVVAFLRDAGATCGECLLMPTISSESCFRQVRELISWSSDHAGAGSFVLDHFLGESIIDSLIQLWETLPVAEEAKRRTSLCSTRKYFCDAVGAITKIICSALMKSFDANDMYVHPHMRFLCYEDSEIDCSPHIDLSRVDMLSGKRSTHSFLLYLTCCKNGGETVLLENIADSKQVVALVNPLRNRLLIFPHQCPHKGNPTMDVPKLLIRGEVRWALSRPKR